MGCEMSTDADRINALANELAREALQSIDVEDGESYAFYRVAIEAVIKKAIAQLTAELAEAQRWRTDAEAVHAQEVAAHERTKAEAAAMRGCLSQIRATVEKMAVPGHPTTKGWLAAIDTVLDGTAGRALAARQPLLEAVARRARDLSAETESNAFRPLREALAALGEKGTTDV